MKSHLYFRSFVLVSVCLAAALAAPAAYGAKPEPPTVQAQVLDHAEVLCANCFFGPSYYYYCFAADNKILVAYQRTQVLNWVDPNKNYLTKVHKGWSVWNAPGQTVPISYDDKHIWVTRDNGKKVKMIQSNTRDIFTGNDRCKAPVASAPVVSSPVKTAPVTTAAAAHSID
jgi:hypothetical protein